MERYVHRVEIKFVPREIQKSEYDWVNITHFGERVGKARCLKMGRTLTIYTIRIFPEYDHHGYGSHFVNTMKQQYGCIVADRVRHSAIGFWEKMGFELQKDGNFKWCQVKNRYIDE